MTRSLRKRHFIVWVVITITLSILLVMSRNSIPVFKGDQSTEQIQP